MQPIQSPAKQFIFRSYSFDHATGEARFVYAIDDQEFTERVTFPLPATGVPDSVQISLERALFALHLIGGVSYYKAKLPKEIVIESGTLTKEEAVFWEKLYTLGLGEFFYRNNLDFRGYIHFPFGDDEVPQAGRVPNASGAWLPIGGGKDSLTAIQMLREAGRPFDLLALAKHARIREVADDLALPLTVIDRRIDPALFELNAQGAWNGHVPITSYVAFASVIMALLHGRRDVIFANERSANIGNAVVDGVEINHQYSKSLENERDMQAYIAASITPDVRVFSLLRPLSELEISRRFAAFGKHYNVFSSCNRNFTQSHVPKVTRWCGKCPKCAFVFVMLASFIPRRKMVEMFGEDLLMKEELLPLYRELLGVDGMKPFECVGEVEEVIAAFALIDGRGEYDDSPIMEVIRRDVLNGRKDLDALIAQSLTPSPDHAMPEEYAELVYATR